MEPRKETTNRSEDKDEIKKIVKNLEGKTPDQLYHLYDQVEENIRNAVVVLQANFTELKEQTRSLKEMEEHMEKERKAYASSTKKLANNSLSKEEMNKQLQEILKQHTDNTNKIKEDHDNGQQAIKGLEDKIKKQRKQLTKYEHTKEALERIAKAMEEKKLNTTMHKPEDVIEATELVDGLEQNLVQESEGLKDKVKSKTINPLEKIYNAVEVIESLILETAGDGTSDFERYNNMRSLVSDIKSLIKNSRVVVSPMTAKENYDKVQELKLKFNKPDMMEKLEVELKTIKENSRIYLEYIAKKEHEKTEKFIKEDASKKVESTFDSDEKSDVTTGHIGSADLKKKGKGSSSSPSR